VTASRAAESAEDPERIDTGVRYAARLARLAASGLDLHGEARFVQARVAAGARVLDAGCGTGRVAARLADLGYDCVGVDVDDSMLAEARRSGSAATWVQGDLTALDLPGAGVAEPFDAVVSAGNVMPLVPAGTVPAVLAGLAAHLRPGGLLIAGFGLAPAHLPPGAERLDLADYDAWCAAAGFSLAERYATWGADPYAGGGYAVSVHRNDAGLDASAAALLGRIRAAGGRALHESTPEQAREDHNASAAALAGPGEDVADVVDTDVDRVPVRIYKPAGASRATVVYAHGGGWVVGTLDGYDTLCRSLANRAGVTVASVGYTLAPARRHPDQVDQVLAVLRWFGRGGAPLALAGDSAGGYLAIQAAARAAEEGIALAALALVYPVISASLATASCVDLATGYSLTTEDLRWCWTHYRPEGAPVDASLDATALELGGLPPSWVLTAGFDPLRDEGVAFAAALDAAGVEVEHVTFDGQMHGFVRASAFIPEASDALAQAGRFLARRLGGTPK
jgi:acetyl esterase